MAGITMGYPFAFQVLGYFSWEVGGNSAIILDEARQYLEDYVYEKLWSELSRIDRKVLYAIALSADGGIGQIMRSLDMDKNYFSNYRARLLRRGLIKGEPRGYAAFTLPMFRSFVLGKGQMEEL